MLSLNGKLKDFMDFNLLEKKYEKLSLMNQTQRIGHDEDDVMTKTIEFVKRERTGI